MLTNLDVAELVFLMFNEFPSPELMIRSGLRFELRDMNNNVVYSKKGTQPSLIELASAIRRMDIGTSIVLRIHTLTLKGTIFKFELHLNKTCGTYSKSVPFWSLKDGNSEILKDNTLVSVDISWLGVETI